MRTIGRTLYFMFRVAILLLPLVIAIRGFFFLRRCLDTLASPGTGIDFTYEARKGATVHITASKFSFLWSQGILQIWDPKLQDSQGELLASADSARIDGLYLGGNDKIGAVIRNLKGKLVRLQNGHFALEEYLPETTPEQQNRPYSVHVQNADLLFEDLSGKGKFDQRAITDDLMVEGMGKDWVASGRLVLPTVGVADAAVQRYDKSGMVIALTSQKLNLGRVINHFRTTPEGKNLDLLSRVQSDTLVARGPVHLFIPDNSPFLVASSLDAEGTNVIYDGKDYFSTAHFVGLITGDGASGFLQVTRPNSVATFVGASDWSKEARFAGLVDAQIANKNAIPTTLQKFVPPSVTFSGAHAKGWISYDAKNGFRYDGGVDASRIAMNKQSVNSAAGAVRAGNGLVRIENAQGVWQGSDVNGSFAYIPDGRKVIGAFAGPKLQLASVSRAISVKGLSGTANAQGLVVGTSDKPVVAFRATGDARFHASGASRTLAGTFHAAANYTNSGLDIASITVDTKTGTIAATGHANPHGQLAMQVAAHGVQLGAFSPDIKGSASFSGAINGTASDPRVVGKAQVVGLAYDQQEIPFVVADISANNRGVYATGIDAVRGAAQANGIASYTFKNGGISANLNAANFPLSEFSDQVKGVVNVTSANVKGTLNHPIVDAKLETHGMVVANRVIGRGKAALTLDGDKFKITEARAQVAHGSVVASASGDIKTKETHVEVSGTNLELVDLAPDLEETASIAGTVSGIAVLNLRGSDIRYARASGKLNNVTVNQTLVGDGPWSASATPQAFGGAVQVGTLDRYLDLSKLHIDRKEETIGADLTAYQIPLSDMYSALARYIPKDLNDVENRLLRVNGILDSQATISGLMKQPDLKVGVLDLTQLALEGQDLGKVSASFNKTGKLWTVATASWDSVAGTLRSSGTIDEDGDVDYQGDFTNVDLGLLSIANDNLTRIRGRAGLSFAVSGPSRNPLMQASLDASHTTFLTGSANPGEVAPQLEFGMVLDTINVSQSTVNPDGTLKGGIEASGKLFYRGLEGNITSQIPLHYPLQFPDGHPLMVNLALPSKPLQSLSDYFASLDPTRTDGTIEGNLGIGGVIGHANLTGNIEAKANSFALKKVQTSIKDVDALIAINQDSLRLHFGATGSEGGTAMADASMPVGDIADRIQDLTSRGLDAILDRPVSGALALNDFGMKYDAGPDGRIIGRADAKIDASGVLRSPLIKGNVNLKGVNTLLPSFEGAPTEPVTYAVNPQFNVTMTMDDLANVSTSLAKMRMIGKGAIGGSLNAPSVTSDLTVMGGTISLPTATVRIDPGGTVKLRYQTGQTGETLARLDVDLTAHTAITTIDVGDIPQRYDIDLSVKGNLLEDGQTFITAESEPPGLSQQRILALLGQADLVSAIAGSVSHLEASKELRNALAGYAVPALLTPITSSLAKGLGLDYLNVEYNPYSQVTIDFAKDLGKNFSIQGRRQISQALPGYKPQFDLSLVYRLNFGGKALRRTTVSFGFDQDRPWKVGIQYGIRF